MPENTFLTTTEIIIQDYNDNKPVVFSSLQLQEAMLSVNYFSFCLQPAVSDEILTSIINFKKDVMGKEVIICFKNADGNNNYKFKGIVNEINSSMIDERYYEFRISGKGVFSRVDELKLCKSFYKKKLDAIIDVAFQNSDLKSSIKKDVQTTKELHYIVQYHQTLFEFISYLAIRFGEWMYYDGEYLQFGKKPDGEPIELNVPHDISNLNIRAQVMRSPKGMVATDIFKSEVVTASSKETTPDHPILKASEDAGARAIEEAPTPLFVASGFNQDTVSDKFKLEQQAIVASSVFLTGSTRNSKLHIGSVVKIKEHADASGKSYIITQITHTASNATNYSNTLTIVPVEIAVPPYTNPLLSLTATPQAAIVTDNEDDAGLARIKVRFPWMAEDEKTPWISVLVPHAGKDKGFRFLPEIEDEVMVGFWDGNVETPFVNGALYTEKNSPGIAEQGNHIKRIGSRSGRRVEINDDEGYIIMSDSLQGHPKNIVKLNMNDERQELALESLKDENNYGVVILNNGEHLSIGLQADGSLVAQLRLLKDGPKILIETKGNIDVNADGSINMNAGGDINIKAQGAINCEAQQNVKIDATQDFKTKAMNVELKGDVSFKADSPMTEVKGVQATLQGDAVTTVKGGLVMIN